MKNEVIHDEIIPGAIAREDKLREPVDCFVKDTGLIPPLSHEELRQYTDIFINLHPDLTDDPDLVSILINNAVWRDTVGSVPFDRRILLIPQCLRDDRVCPARIDEFGLLCEQCGACCIGELQELAEALGYIVLVAEGTTVVSRLLESGKVDAVIGVSCRSVLEKTFPLIAADAIPGLAVPLLTDGCLRTQVNLQWLRELIKLHNPRTPLMLLNVELLRQQVERWFMPESLGELLETPDESSKLAMDWLAKSGKRWRPLLVLAGYRALRADTEENADDSVPRALAIAVECFHKASLIHDDIEDGDKFRYGAKTMHCEYGIPVALNVGDLLLGEGYCLISRCGASPECIAELLQVAAVGHRNLCLGQGKELISMHRTEPIKASELLEIFRLKTSPAFEVALQLGTLAAGIDHKSREVLGSFSDALGVAYQIRDDIQDYHFAVKSEESCELGSSLLLSLAWEHADAASREKLLATGTGEAASNSAIAFIEKFGVEAKALQLLEHYRHEAVRSLNPLRNSALKSLLHRIITRILEDRGIEVTH